MNVNPSKHKENQDQNASVGGRENFRGRNDTPNLGGVTAPTNTSGMTCSASVLPITIKKVDFIDLSAGRTDHRSPSKDTAKASLDSCSDNGGPRKAFGQFKGSRNEKTGKFQSAPTGLDSDAGN
jgi:hypothetical protein